MTRARVWDGIIVLVTDPIDASPIESKFDRRIDQPYSNTIDALSTALKECCERLILIRDLQEFSDRMCTESTGAGHTKHGLGVLVMEKRNQNEAYRVAREAYPFRCCVVCGLQVQTCLTVAHLDHKAGRNEADNLAWLCWTHHWMFDADFYPIKAIKLMRQRRQ